MGEINSEKQVVLLAKISPELLPTGVAEQLALIGSFEEDPETYIETYTLKPNLEQADLTKALTEINNLTQTLSAAWVHFINNTLGFVPSAPVQEYHLDIAKILIAIEVYLAQQFKQNPTQINDEKRFLLAVWRAQLNSEDEDNWAAYLLPGITPPPTLIGEQSLANINLDTACIVKGKYLLTWAQIYRFTRDWLDANPSEKMLLLAADPNAGIDKITISKEETSVESTENTKKKVNCFLDNDEINAFKELVGKEHVQGCIDLLNKAIKESVNITTTLSFLNHIRSLLIKGSVKGDERLDIYNSSKEEKASQAAHVAMIWLGEWLDILKDEEIAENNDHYSQLMGDKSFTAIIHRLKIVRHSKNDVSLTEISTDNCVDIVQGKLSDYLSQRKHPHQAILSSPLAGKEKLLVTMNTTPAYMLNFAVLNKADEFQENWENSKRYSSRVFAIDKILYDKKVYAISFMPFMKDVYNFYTVNTRKKIYEYYQNALKNDKSSDKSLADLHGVVFLKAGGLKRISKVHDRLYESVNRKTKDKKDVWIKSTLPLLKKKKENENEFEKTEYDLAKKTLDLLSNDIETEENNILGILNQSIKITEKHYDQLFHIEAYEHAVQLLFDVARGLPLTELIDNQTDTNCNVLLNAYYTTLSVLEDNLSLNSIMLVNLRKLKNEIKPISRFIVDNYLTALKAADNASALGFKSGLTKYLPTFVSDVIKNADNTSLLATATQYAGRLKFLVLLFRFLELSNIENLLANNKMLTKIVKDSNDYKKIISNRIKTLCDDVNSITTDLEYLSKLAFAIIPCEANLLKFEFNPQTHPSTAALILIINNILKICQEDDRYKLFDALEEFTASLGDLETREMARHKLFEKAILDLISFIPTGYVENLKAITGYLNKEEAEIFFRILPFRELMRSKKLLEPFNTKCLKAESRSLQSITLKNNEPVVNELFIIPSILANIENTLTKQLKYTGILKPVENLVKLFPLLNNLNLKLIIENANSPLCCLFITDFANSVLPLVKLANNKSLDFDEMVETLDRLDFEHINNFLCPAGQAIVKQYIPYNTKYNLDNHSETRKIIELYKKKSTNTVGSINGISSWINYFNYLKGFGQIKRSENTVLLNELGPAIDNIQSEDDLRPIANRLETIKKICNRCLLAKYTMDDDFDAGKHQSTAMMLLVLKNYKEYTDNQLARHESFNNKKDKLITGYEAVNKILKSKSHQNISREELFAQIMRAIYAPMAINTGNNWRSKTHGEQLIWDNLLPILNEKEKIILHAEMTRARLKRSRQDVVTSDKIAKIDEDVKLLYNGDNDLESVKKTFLNHYQVRRNPVFRSFQLTETTSAKSFRKIMRIK